MKNFLLTLVYPVFPGRIKFYQNLLLIIAGATLMLSLALSWFDNHQISIAASSLFDIGIVLTIFLIFLSIPFLFKIIEITPIKNGIISFNQKHTPTKIDIRELHFILNIDRKLFIEGKPTVIEAKDLTTWGNYIVLPATSSASNTFIPFIPDESFLEIIPQLNFVTYKHSSILMLDTKDFIKNFVDGF